ncbi:MAG: hypothetical protein FWG83_05010 [Oscillospiraceae bacterium]|nr:hypothetical protein [Oscillospiraceae bacterium]
MTIETLHEAGRLPHAILLLGGNAENVEQALKLYKCEPADTVYVKEGMPASDSEKKSKKQPPYSYKIDALRSVISSGNLRPQFGESRVFVFNDFDSMGEERSGIQCQNALLKFFEEPHEFNRFILTAESSSKILTTILSRVVVIRGKFQVEETQDTSEHDEIAKTALAALIRKSEYETAAAFTRAKDKQSLKNVFVSLIDEFANTAKNADSDSAAQYLKACDVVRKYIGRIAVNPSVPLTASACTAELYSILY